MRHFFHVFTEDFVSQINSNLCKISSLRAALVAGPPSTSISNYVLTFLSSVNIQFISGDEQIFRRITPTFFFSFPDEKKSVTFARIKFRRCRNTFLFSKMSSTKGVFLSVSSISMNFHHRVAAFWSGKLYSIAIWNNEN